MTADIEVRCELVAPSGHRCGKLLLKIGTGNTGPIEPFCTRCKCATLRMSSEVGRRGVR